MAVIKQGILGGFQNKIGSVVGSSWKGIAVMKSKPVSVANPRTAAQVTQRTKMSNCVAFAQFFLTSYIKPLWDRFATQMSGFNDFLSTNIAQFAAQDPATPSTLVMSRGKMAATAISSKSADKSDGFIQVSWANDSGQGLKLATDHAYIAVYNSSQHLGIVEAAGTVRSSMVSTFSIPTAWVAGNVLHIWLSFRRADGTVVSESSYASVNIVA